MDNENIKNAGFAIAVNWEVSEESGSETFDLNDMNCNSISEWMALTIEEKRERIQKALDDLPERVFIHLSTFSELD